MPNHETNNVVIIGAPDNIRRLIAEALIDYPAEALSAGETLDNKPAKIIEFTRIVPEPENIERGGCPHGTLDLGANGEYIDADGREMVCWYRWNIDHWGTKWGAYSHSHYALYWLKPWSDDGEVYGRVDLRFETAWSQPTPIFEAIEQRWGVKVHAVTQDEGGYPDVLFGTPLDLDLMSETRTFEFHQWANSVPEPLEVEAA